MSFFGRNAKDSKRVVPPSLVFINNQPGNSLFNILNPLSLSSTADSLSLAHQVEEKIEQQNSSYNATRPRIPLFIEYFMYNQDNEYTVYNVNHEFSYLVEQVRAEMASSSIPPSALLASGTTSPHDSEKLVVLIEFDLEKIETTLCNVDMLTRDFGSSTCYFGFVLMVDHHVAKYGDDDEEKLDYIQQLVRSLALRVPNSFVISVSQTRPDTSHLCTKYLLHLLHNLEQQQSGNSIDGQNHQSFPPKIVDFESLFIPVSYDSVLKINTVNESFPVESYVEMAQLQEQGLAASVSLVLEGKQQSFSEQDVSIAITARDEQGLLASVKGVVDKLNEDRQAIKRVPPSSYHPAITATRSQTEKSPLGTAAASSSIAKTVISSGSKSSLTSSCPISSSPSSNTFASSRVGGMVAPTATDLRKGGDLKEYNSKDVTSTSSSFGTSSAAKNQLSSKASATLPHDQDDMSAKIAKLLEQSKSVKDKFSGLSKSSTAAGSEGTNSNEILSEYFASLLKK